MNWGSNLLKIGHVFLAILIFVFFFLGLGGYDLAAPDEPRFALVAREMLTDNHWVLPHRNEKPYPDKPPFFFWTIAAFSALAGGTVNAVTARLPSAIAATLVILLMYRWNGKKEQNALLSFLTALLLLSCSKFFFQARIAQIDMLLCFFVTAALLIGYSAMSDESYSPFWLGMCLGAGALTKGPVGILIPLGSLSVFAAVSGRVAWWKFPLKALLWMLVPIFLWLAMLLLDVALHRQWDYLFNLLFKQTVVRYFNAWHHHQPFYYFFLSILYDFMPWTPFLLISIPFNKTRWRSLDQKQKFSWSVILFTLVFFSLSKGKRSIYILPVFPFAAYLSAIRLNILILKKKADRPEILAGAFPGFILFIAGAALLTSNTGWVKLPLPDWIDAPLPIPWLLAGGALLLVISAGVMVSSFKSRFKEVSAGIIAGMLVINFLFFSIILPWIDPYRSSRGFMEQANQIIHGSPTHPVVGMVDFREAFRLYGDFPLVELSNDLGGPRPELPKLEDFFKQYPRGWAIVRENDWNLFAKTHDLNVTVFLKKKIGSGENFMLLAQTQPNGVK
jgi:4-amino-4-deoxy-L-arabinose transferase-like glycosyltransferase